jgi:hypothetical protein
VAKLAYGSIVTLGLFAISPSSTAIDRISLYLIPIQMLVFSRLPTAFPGHREGTKNQLMLVLIAYCAIVQFVWLNYATHSYLWVPYQLYFSAEAQNY